MLAAYTESTLNGDFNPKSAIISKKTKNIKFFGILFVFLEIITLLGLKSPFRVLSVYPERNSLFKPFVMML